MRMSMFFDIEQQQLGGGLRFPMKAWRRGEVVFCSYNILLRTAETAMRDVRWLGRKLYGLRYLSFTMFIRVLFQQRDLTIGDTKELVEASLIVLLLQSN